MLTKEMVDVVEELRRILGSIEGVSRLEERVALSYFVIVENDDKKEAANKVGGMLSEQASKYGFDLDIRPLTEDELTELKNEYLKEESNKSKFKFLRS